MSHPFKQEEEEEEGLAALLSKEEIEDDDDMLSEDEEETTLGHVQSVIDSIPISASLPKTKDPPPPPPAATRTTHRPPTVATADPASRKRKSEDDDSPTKKKKTKKRPSSEESPLPESDTSVASPPRHHHHHHGDLAGVYAPLLRLRRKRELDASPLLPLPPRTVGGLRDQMEKTKQCNCKRSHCLKLYCECFASGIHCSSLCNCASCRNNSNHKENASHRHDAILSTLDRNPHAFRPRALAMAGAAASVGGPSNARNNTQKPRGGENALLSTTTSSATPTLSYHRASAGGPMGCNCKKSFCLKKYCECFHAAVYCSAVHCRCTDCQNTKGNVKREHLVAKRRSQAEAAAAAAALAHQHSRLSSMGGRFMGDAGRAYYTSSSEITAAAAAPAETTSQTEMEAAVAAGAAAGGVDVFLPPSSYTVPMQMSNGMPFAALSFGTTGPRDADQNSNNGEKNLSSTALATTTTTSRAAPNPPRQVYGPFAPPVNRKYGWKRRAGITGGRVETELERNWRLETELAKATLDAMRAELQKKPNGVSTTTTTTTATATLKEEEATDAAAAAAPSKKAPAQKKKKPSKGELERMAKEEKKLTAETRARAMLSSVQGNVRQLVAATQQAQDRAQEFLRKKHDDQTSSSTPVEKESSSPIITSPSVAALTCSEQMEDSPVTTEVSDYASREFTILAAQDAALLQELTRMIRQEAIAMGQERMRRAREMGGT